MNTFDIAEQFEMTHAEAFSSVHEFLGCFPTVAAEYTEELILGKWEGIYTLNEQDSKEFIAWMIF